VTRKTVVRVVLALVCSGADLGAQAETPRADELESVAWMAGCWGAGGAQEQWMSPAGGLMVGMSRTVRDGQALGYEFLLLRVLDGRLEYWALPSGQAPTSFHADSLTDGEVVFTNAEHDFPQKIRYRRAPPDRLVASVFGDVDDERPAFELDYRRVPCLGSDR
jgi:hypothetical protein